MPALTALQISQLPSFGPLSGLPPGLHARLTRLELLDSERLLRGTQTLAFNLRGISALVNLQELRIDVKR